MEQEDLTTLTEDLDLMTVMIILLIIMFGSILAAVFFYGDSLIFKGALYTAGSTVVLQLVNIFIYKLRIKKYVKKN
jgi:hypothetical protein